MRFLPFLNALDTAELSVFDVGRAAPGSRVADRFPEQTPRDGAHIPMLAEVPALGRRPGADGPAGRGPTRWRRWNASLAWRIEFDAGALKDLRGLDRQVARRITLFLGERLGVMDDPRGLGAPPRTTGSRLGTVPLWRYRVGDWRIVARIEDEVLRVLVLRIAHHRAVYRRS